MSKIGRTNTKAITFLASKDLIAQIIICEGLDRYISGRTIDSYSKDELVDRLMEGEHYIELDHQTSRLKTVQQKQTIDKENEIGFCLEPHTQDLQKLFAFYSSYGEPENYD